MRQGMLVVLLLAGSALVGGCASVDSRYDRYDNGGTHYNAGRSNEGYYAVVDSIEPTRGASNDNAIAGPVVGGAVAGAVVGHQIGQGDGRDGYRVRIRFDDGSYQTTTQPSIGTLRIGDSVRIEKGRVVRY
jgi:outer membrane lipoprotein SlyB